MIRNHPHVVLYNPEIPQNTGNIGRLVAATAGRLHLIEPLGFSLDDKNVRRPGLDYWPCLDLEIHANFDDFCQTYPGQKMAFLTKFASQSYFDIPPDVDTFVFGCETSGLPQSIHAAYSDRLYSIPMFHPEVRSLNLANSVALVVYEHIRKKRLDLKEL